jgi:Ca2+/Na+ antiporter
LCQERKSLILEFRTYPLALSLFLFPILEREENRRIVFLAVCLLFLFLILERERERERERIKRKKTQQSNSLLRGICKRNAAM